MKTNRMLRAVARCQYGLLALLLVGSVMMAWPAMSTAATQTVVPIVFPFEQRVSWTDTFGAPRSGGRTHAGNDIMVPKMTPVLAVADGVLDWMNDEQPYDIGYGGVPAFSILLRGDDGNCYFYIHLNNDTPGTDDGAGGTQYAYAPGLRNGSRVTAGQIIGYAGDSGNAENSGSHLHFELHLGGYGNPINPYQSLMEAALFEAWSVPFRSYTGIDRYETAILVSKAAYPEGAPAVFLVKGDDFPDALAAAPLAHAYGGPVMLTPSTGLTPAVKAELQRLSPSKVFFVGLPAALLPALEEVLPDASIETVRGTDRYETATLLAQELTEKAGPVSTFVLASGDQFPDALSVAPLAALKGWAVLLTPQAGPLPDVTAAEIEALGATTALVVGTRVEPPQSVAEVVSKVGTDRYHTSALIAEYAAAEGCLFTHVGLATGTKYPDALVMGPYLAQDQGILLLTRGTLVPEAVRAQLSAHKEQIEILDVVGLSSSILDVLRGIR